MKLVGLFVTTLVALGSCNTALNEFASGNLKFTAKLYNEVLRSNPNKSFIFSPFSIEVILALTRAGARGQTFREFGSALNLPSLRVTEQALKQFLPTFKTLQNDVKLFSANKIYLRQNFEILNEFKNLATDTFDASIENVDFSKSQQATETINQWVEEQTNYKIKNLIKPSAINGLTRLLLINTLYFNGKWVTPFNPRTNKEKFYVSNTETKEVDMMYVEDSFRYFESAELKAKFLELPYLGGNISMTIVLPNEKEGLSAIENNIGALLAPQNLEFQRVSVRLPAFLVESDLELKPMLQKLGLTTVFSNNADLSYISKETLKVDDIIQKAFINVTTSGTEAAAATAEKVYTPCSFLPPNAVFIADHPFFYYLRFKNTTLFAGTLKTMMDYHDIFYKCSQDC